MKKKIWIPIVMIFILAILVVPIPTGVYRDGGTREYTALTYKIVDWHRDDGMSVYDETCFYFFPKNFRSIDALWQYEEGKVLHTFIATVIEINGQTVTVQPAGESALYFSSDKITFNTKELEKIDAPVGSVIRITYRGGIIETYPLQINAVSWELTN